MAVSEQAKKGPNKANKGTKRRFSRLQVGAVIIAVIAVLIPLLYRGVQELVSLGVREARWHHDAVERQKRESASESEFQNFPVQIKAEAHRDVGFVYHPKAGGFLVQVQQPVEANTSLVRIPLAMVLDARSVCDQSLLGLFCGAVDAARESIAQSLFPDVSFDHLTRTGVEVLDRSIARLKLIAALVALRRAAEHSISPPERFAVLLPWVRTALIPDENLNSNLQLLPHVASRCNILRADREAWLRVTDAVAKDRRVINEYQSEIPGGGLSFSDVTWAVTVLRRRSWRRPAPAYQAVVPLLDLNDQRVGDGVKAALRADRSMTATVIFEDESERAHLVTLTALSRGAYPVVRGDDDAEFPFTASTTSRLYGFFDNATTAVPSHALPLFESLDTNKTFAECTQQASLYYNATSGVPSPALVHCTQKLLGVTSMSDTERFLQLHAARAAKELYDLDATFGCEKLSWKATGRLADQARLLLAVFKHARNGLMTAGKLLP